jgi:hypothetical protein
VRTVVKADTPTATVTKGNEQYSAPWVVESPGGTVTTSAYNDGKKRCLSAEEGSGNPSKISEQNNTFTKAYRKSGLRISVNEIRAEALIAYRLSLSFCQNTTSNAPFGHALKSPL